MRAGASEEGQQQLQDRKQQLSVAVTHRGDEAVRALSQQVVTVMVTGSEVNELALGEVVECVNGGQFPGTQRVAGYSCQEGLEEEERGRDRWKGDGGRGGRGGREGGEGGEGGKEKRGKVDGEK